MAQKLISVMKSYLQASDAYFEDGPNTLILNNLASILDVKLSLKDHNGSKKSCNNSC